MIDQGLWILRAWIYEGKLIVPFTGGDRKYNTEIRNLILTELVQCSLHLSPSNKHVYIDES